jgi:hypothetical protein
MGLLLIILVEKGSVLSFAGCIGKFEIGVLVDQIGL